MNFLKRITAITLTTALVFGVVATVKPSEAADVTFTNEQARELVKAGIEKHKAHNAICYTLEGDETWSFYAYDFEKEIGGCLTGVDANAFLSRDTGMNDECDWIDFKNKIYYEGYYNDNDELVYTYEPIDDDDAKEFKDYYFSYIEEEKTDGFPLADTYNYLGMEWEYGPDDTRHQCYVFEVPDSDPSLYDIAYKDLEETPYYLPVYVYVGVDDGEIYRIDEERYESTSFLTAYNRYETHFEYPEAVEVPESVKNNARLSDEYQIVDKGIEYFVSTDDVLNMTSDLFVYGFSEKAKASQVKNVKLPATLKVLGKNYKVRYIAYAAFSGEKEIKTVKLGKNIDKIEDNAFMGCINMKKFSFAKSHVSVIENAAFKGCQSLKELNIPNAIKTIGKFAFRKCSSLKKVTIGKKIKTIGKGAFRGCRKLKTLKIKNKKMRKYANSSKGRKELGLGQSVVVK